MFNSNIRVLVISNTFLARVTGLGDVLHNPPQFITYSDSRVKNLSNCKFKFTVSTDPVYAFAIVR